MSGCTWKCQVDLDVWVCKRCNEVFGFASRRLCLFTWSLPGSSPAMARQWRRENYFGGPCWLYIAILLEATFMLDSGLSTNLVHGPQLQVSQYAAPSPMMIKRLFWSWLWNLGCLQLVVQPAKLRNIDHLVVANGRNLTSSTTYLTSYVVTWFQVAKLLGKIGLGGWSRAYGRYCAWAPEDSHMAMWMHAICWHF